MVEFNTTYPCVGVEAVRITEDSHNVDIEIIDATLNRENDKAFENYLGIIRGDVYDACHDVVDKFIIIKEWNEYVPISLVFDLVEKYIELRKFKNASEFKFTPPVFFIFDKEHKMARTWMTDLYFDSNFKVADHLTFFEKLVMINTKYNIYEKLSKNVYSDHTCLCNKNESKETN